MTEAVTIIETDHGSTRHSPSDVLRLAVAATVTMAALVLEWLTEDSIPQIVADLLQGLDVVPEWLLHVVLGAIRVGSVTLLVIGLVAVIRHRRWRNLLTVAVAVGLAVAATMLTNSVAPDAADAVIDLGNRAVREFPTSVGLAAAAAAVTAAAPWLSRRWRRFSWAAVLGLAFARFFTTPISFETERAVLLGWLAGAVTVVVLGGPTRRPRGQAIVEGLAAVGVPVVRLEQASLDARGSTPYFAEAADGRPLFVKALGQDERSADLMFRIYRWILPRDLGDERPASSLRGAVEHEALVSLFAKQHGVRTPEVVALAAADPNAFVVAYEAIDGRSLDRLEPAEVTDALLREVWEQVAVLRRYRIAHRDLRLANIFAAADGAVWMIDFGFSELAASDTHLAGDVAELLASSTLIVGAVRAVDAATSVLGSAVVATAKPRLELWALSGATRTAMKQRDGLLEELTGRLDRTAASASR